jgi:2-keto-3-deoxy-L-rhamnonate aldolase RhmA
MPDSQRSNTLGERLENDEVALGVLDSTYSPTLVELYGDLGLDFVWIDLEHGGPSPWDAGALENLLRAAEVTDTELLVRVPTSQPEGIRKALDAGVRNVFLARAEGAAEVRQAVETVRSKAIDAGVPVGGLGFGMDDVNEKVEQGYRMLNLGSTTGALQAAVGDWLDAFEGDRP